MTKVILITGGSGKFGRKLVASFLAKGNTVIFTSRSEKSIMEVSSAHPDAGKRLIGLQIDFLSEDSAKTIASELRARKLFPVGLVNNARNQEFLKINKDGMVGRKNFIGEFLVDVVAPYELTMALATEPESKLSRVVNIGSQYGIVAANPALYTNHAQQSPLHYSVAKAALAHLTRELAVRLASKQILVNCIAFGGVEGRVDESFKQRYSNLVPLGRMLREDEVVGPVNYLLSNECGGVTGQILAVDGGWSIW